MRHIIEKNIPMAEAISKLLHPFAEVIIHDLAQNKIQAVFNPFSKSKVGDPSNLDKLQAKIKPQDKIIGPYSNINLDGRNLKSISIIIRDEASNELEGLLCINLDVSVFDSYAKTLDLFLSNHKQAEENEKEDFFRDNLYERIHQFIEDYCREHNLNPDKLKYENHRQIIIELKNQGALDRKHATQYAATILNISRATVYNYLKQIK